MRKTLALIVALGLLSTLAACSTNASAPGCTSIVSGDASSVIKATGKFAKAPKVSFPTPIVTKKTEKTDLIKGKGAQLEAGQSVLVDATILSGKDASVLQTTTYGKTGSSIITLGKSTLPALGLGLECETVGSRVAIASSPKDAGQTGTAGSIIFVVDIRAAYPAKADGTDQVPESGMPAVVTAPDGTPGITIPDETAPKTMKVSVLKSGRGTKVAKNDTVVLKYTGLTWSDSKVFDKTTWSTNTAAVLPMSTQGTFGNGDAIPAGFVNGLVGKTVGSQVLIVAPPKDGYGSAGSSTVAPNQTLVFVVDILGIVS